MTCVPLKNHTPTELARRENGVPEIIVAQRVNHPHFRLNTAHIRNQHTRSFTTSARSQPKTTSIISRQPPPTIDKSP